jgi:hypothetical protein
MDVMLQQLTFAEKGEICSHYYIINLFNLCWT